MGGAAVVTPNSESVADLTVVTSDYSAEDGRDSGAQIKTTTKSGTDQFHGSGIFLYQDPNFNAYNKYGDPTEPYLFAFRITTGNTQAVWADPSSKTSFSFSCLMKGFTARQLPTGSNG